MRRHSALHLNRERQRVSRAALIRKCVRTPAHGIGVPEQPITPPNSHCTCTLFTRRPPAQLAIGSSCHRQRASHTSWSRSRRRLRRCRHPARLGPDPGVRHLSLHFGGRMPSVSVCAFGGGRVSIRRRVVRRLASLASVRMRAAARARQTRPGWQPGGASRGRPRWRPAYPAGGA